MDADVTYAQLEIDAVSSKFLSQKEVGALPSGSLILTKGCFDILHGGHMALFAHCARLKALTNASAVLVAVESDESVRIRKGPERPYQNERARAVQLALMPSIDYVVIIAADELANLLAKCQPLVYIKGMDTALALDPGKAETVQLEAVRNPEILSLRGNARTIIFADDGKLSTSAIVQRIRQG